MADPSVEDRLSRLNKALGVATALLDASSALWENDCERIFSELRVSCVHLRREQEALDSVEDKAGAWRFIINFAKTRPFLHDRCNEVLRILMKSELWMKAFTENPDFNVEDLPESIREEFEQRAKEVTPDPEPTERRASDPDAARAPPPNGRGPPRGDAVAAPPAVVATRPSNLAVVVQRCTKARILLDERAQWWDEIDRGLVISVSFAKGAKEEAVHHAARFLLTAKLSCKDAPRGAPPRIGADAEAVATLCKAGEEQGVLVLPQASLCSELGKDNIGLQYDHLCPQATAAGLYKVFVEALRSAGTSLIGKAKGAKELKVVCANFHGPQYLEMMSAGPFTHAFNF